MLYVESVRPLCSPGQFLNSPESHHHGLELQICPLKWPMMYSLKRKSCLLYAGHFAFWLQLFHSRRVVLAHCEAENCPGGAREQIPKHTCQVLLPTWLPDICPARQSSSSASGQVAQVSRSPQSRCKRNEFLLFLLSAQNHMYLCDLCDLGFQLMFTLWRAWWPLCLPWSLP